VQGDLTLHGVTKPITLKVEQTGQAAGRGGSRAGFETVFTIKRSDYGMTNMLDAVGDDVRITADIEAMGN
jgi:polyisoprenoid-binding protein YceI